MGRPDDGLAQLSQGADREPPNRLIVFHQKDTSLLVDGGKVDSSSRDDLLARSRPGAGKVQAEHSAMLRFALDRDVATRLLGKTVRLAEA